ncbi:ribonuclease P protein component [Sunxiuqinia sp. sy24]|uniref:ribonuclease P protein component n=1 Tax=Sunxiuqinia sp. sy24 TaxID=3461495 RepID=UPI0040451BF4
MHTFKLTKKERLCSTKMIGKLFEQGASFYIFPLKVVYLPMALRGTHPIEVSFSVSKRNFKHAVVRNLLKRRMREAFRLNKPDFYERLPEGTQVAVMIIYTCKEVKDYRAIEKGMQKALKRLGELLQ